MVASAHGEGEQSSTFHRRQELASAVTRMFAHWFQVEDEATKRESATELGWFRKEVTCGPDVSAPFWVTREEFVAEGAFLNLAQALLDRIAAEGSTQGGAIDDQTVVRKRHSSPLEVELLQKDLALFWLNKADPRVEWEGLLVYAEFLRHRTYENDPVCVNLVIDPARDDGKLRIELDDSDQKILDPLAASMDVFIKVDKKMRIVDYLEVESGQLAADSTSGCPSFLAPIVQGLGEGQFSFHRTRRGDVVIANRNGLVAAWRKGSWYLYEVEKLALTLQDLCRFSADKLSESLLTLIMDLSYKRHGALLVFDPAGKVVGSIDPGQLVAGGASDRVRNTFSPAVELVDLAALEPAKRRQRIVGQIASVDGAVIFNNEKIKAFGAILPQKGAASGKAGTRTLAAYSSRELGGTAVKISADGDVLIPLFIGDGDSRVAAVLRFA